MTIVALIPARAGSKRIPGKNTRLLAGQPLIAYTIAAAQQSGIFERIYVVSDDPVARGIALALNVEVRNRAMSTDDEPDIAWVRTFLDVTIKQAALGNGSVRDAFAILRPTSPFRTAATMQRAWAEFQANQHCDSLRAVERWTGPSPYKMWRIAESQMVPLIPNFRDTPWHSSPTQTHPPVYLQNASLEIAWTRTVTELGSISGKIISPFFTEGHEGFDLNTEADWMQAEALIASGAAVLPPIEVPCPR